MRVPDWYAILLLAFAAFRVWKLIGEDTILDWPRARVIEFAFHRGGTKAKDYVETLLECPWCAGFWVSLAWWGAWEAWPHTTLIVAAPFVVSALVGLVAHFWEE